MLLHHNNIWTRPSPGNWLYAQIRYVVNYPAILTRTESNIMNSPGCQNSSIPKLVPSMQHACTRDRRMTWPDTIPRHHLKPQCQLIQNLKLLVNITYIFPRGNGNKLVRQNLPGSQTVLERCHKHSSEYSGKPHSITYPEMWTGETWCKHVQQNKQTNKKKTLA